MDIQDVSSVGECIQILTHQKEILRAAAERTGEVPTDRKSRVKIIENHEKSARTSAKQQEAPDGHPTLQILFLPPRYLPSSTPLGDLEKMHIKDMLLETHHRGFYVVLRVATQSHRMGAIITVVEDERADVAILQLHQQEGEDVRPAHEIVREKSICILKEPYFRSLSRGRCGFRVDHISDLVWLEKNDDRIPLSWLPRFVELDKTADDWKQEGNADYVDGKVHEAVEKYFILARLLLCFAKVNIDTL